MMTLTAPVVPDAAETTWTIVEPDTNVADYDFGSYTFMTRADA